MTDTRAALAALLAFSALVDATSAQDGLPGEPIHITGTVAGQRPGKGTVIVRCYRLHTSKAGKPRRMSRHGFYHGEPAAVVIAENGRFRIDHLHAAHYSIVAFQDLDGDGALDFAPPEPLGWHCAQPSGRIDPIDVRTGSKDVRVLLRATTPPGTSGTVRAKGAADSAPFTGQLTRVHGLTTVRLRGTPAERGRAHGLLLARQILDFFEFYILEDKFGSARLYQSTFVPFLEKNFRWPKALLTEVDAVVAGMKESGVGLRVASLDRDFDRTDLLAINSYIETRAMRSSCTQFAFWGERTKGTDVGGGLIAGRNMDGEIDIRKTTVSHFVVFAVDQQDAAKKRYLNLMWPGFVGTLSGINEDGLYSMENAGGSGPGSVVDSLVPVSWTQRFILENVSGAAQHTTVEHLIDAQHSSGGGSCGPGSIILFATPFTGQAAPAFVYEGDRFSGTMRLPNEVRPKGPNHIIAANHHLKYGVDADRPGVSFGKRSSFSSRWRYEAGLHLVESWTRADRRIGTAEMVRLLQTVAHGTTEHSIIFRANQKTLDIAVDDLLADMWDAPYRKWHRVRFAEFFAPSRPR